MPKTIIESLRTERARAKTRPPLPWPLRILSFIFAINIVITLAVLIFSSRDLVAYDSTNLFDWLNLVFEAVLIWLIWYRFRVARNFALAFTVFNAVAGTISEIVTGTFDPFIQLITIIPDALVFCYFYFNPDVRRVLSEDLTLDVEEYGTYEVGGPSFTWPFLRNMTMYFCVFSFLGHWMEMCFCLAIKAGLVGGEYDPSNTMLWRDWFYPFPMHGMAVILIGVALYPLWRWLVGKTSPFIGSAISFVCNGIACGTIEFVCGLMWNADLQNWDYTPMPFNFMGQVCLQNVIGFAFAASIIAWFVYPWLERTIAKLPVNAVNIAFVVTGVAFLVSAMLYLVAPPLDYRTEIENALARDDADPTYLTEAERADMEKDLAYLDYLDEYRAENAARIERERAEAMAQPRS